MNALGEQMTGFVGELVAMVCGSGKGVHTRQEESGRQDVPAEKVTDAAGQADEIAYLKMILDGLVQNRSLFETGDVDLDEEFLQELRNSVDSILKADSRFKKEVRIKVLNAFNVLIDNYPKYFKWKRM